MESNLTKDEALALSKKALKDVGHWEDFKLENARFFDNEDDIEDYNHWYVWFNFSEDDWKKGEITPTLTINDESGKVLNVSWKKSVFPLSYDKDKDIYYHPTLSREQPEL